MLFRLEKKPDVTFWVRSRHVSRTRHRNEEHSPRKSLFDVWPWEKVGRVVAWLSIREIEGHSAPSDVYFPLPSISSANAFFPHITWPKSLSNLFIRQVDIVTRVYAIHQQNSKMTSFIINNDSMDGS